VPGLPLPEGTVVEVMVREPEQPERKPPVGLLQHFKGLSGLDLDSLEDASLDVDHYLHGHPKR